ncbi:MAG TPA: ATP-binding protein [Thermodesulfobacteriota bacterium]
MTNAGRPMWPVQARRRIRDLIEGLGAIFWEADAATWQFTFVSRRAEDILGYPIERWLGTPDFWVSLVHPDDREAAIAHCEESMRDGRDHEVEYRVVAADGRVVWLHELVHVVRDPEGRAQKLRGVMLDISARKRVEEALKARVRQQAAVADLGQRALAGVDVATLMNDAVGLVARTLQVEYAKVLELLPDGATLRLRAGVGWGADLVGRATVGSGRDSQAGYTLLYGEPVIVEDWRTERRFKLPPVHQAHQLTSGVTVIIDGRRRPFGVLGAHSCRPRTFTRDDIHFLQAVANVLAMAIERKWADESQRFLAEASRQLAGSLDYDATLASVSRLAVPRLADCCVVDLVDRDRSIRRLAATHVDPEKEALARELLRVPPDAASRHPIPEAIRSGRPEVLADAQGVLPARVGHEPRQLEVLEALRLRQLMVVPLVARNRTLGAITFASTSSARYDDADLALAEDLARRAALAADNARLYEEAQEAIRVRDDFLARASHELRTPLTVVKGNLAFFTRGVAPAEGANLVSAARRHVDQMIRLLNDLLDASRLAAGQLPLDVEAVELAAEVAEVLGQVAPLAQEKGVAILNAVEPGLALVGDRLKIEQILVNLLTNAIKHTPSGGTIRVTGYAAGGELEVRVQDSGAGIPREHLERIFEPFVQITGVSGRPTAARQGAGLGLAIARRLTELHGGRIWAESAGLGCGSTFVLRLPAATGRERAA